MGARDWERQKRGREEIEGEGESAHREARAEHRDEKGWGKKDKAKIGREAKKGRGESTRIGESRKNRQEKQEAEWEQGAEQKALSLNRCIHPVGNRLEGMHRRWDHERWDHGRWDHGRRTWSSLSTLAKVESWNCSGKHCRRASRALQYRGCEGVQQWGTAVGYSYKVQQTSRTRI